ncbi:MAG TPA: ANTAR domain-containing protein [Friedmanniella sp.]
MDLTASFLQSVSRQMADGSLTPSVLARAATDLLPVDGAGLSTLLGLLRLPLGASDAAAQTAEVLQTSLGEGPCLAAAVAKKTCVADLAELTTRWPVYGEELVRRTPFRSVASVPLRTPDGEVYAALDLYAEDEHLSTRLDLEGVGAYISAPMSALLGICLAEVSDVDAAEDLPRWYQAASARRHHVWVATGMLIGSRGRSTHDALSLLRAYAFTQERSLDDLADDLVEGRLSIADLDQPG